MLKDTHQAKEKAGEAKKAKEAMLLIGDMH